MDWADRIADILEFGGPKRDTVSSIAQELRKAKADGVREGAKYAPDAKTYEYVMKRAAEIEKGNA